MYNVNKSIVSESKAIHENNTKSKNDDEMAVSKFRIAASQIVPTLAINILKFSYGNCLGFTQIFIARLYNETAEISVTVNELTWYGSFCFMAPVGALSGGFVAQKIGSRLLLMITAIELITAWLIYHWAESSAMILCAQAIMGLARGISMGPMYIYTAEILQPSLRGILMSTSNLFFLFGIFFSTLLGGYLYWRTIVLVNLIFPLIGFIMMLFIPESPQWFANKNRFDDAESSLAWFRGWTDVRLVRNEFISLKTSLNSAPTFAETNITDVNVSSDKRAAGLKETIKPFLHKTFYIPLLIVSYMFLITALCGVQFILLYSGIIFPQIKSPIEVHTSTVIFNAVRLIGAILCTFTIRFVGKRKLVFFSLFGGGSSFTLVAIFGFLIYYNYVDSQICFWIPTVSIFIGTFAIASGIEKVTYLLTGELFPSKHRSIGGGISHFINDVILAVFNKVSLDIVNIITLPGTFAFFAIVNTFGLLTVYFILPETEGRTLDEIEEHFAGGQKLRTQKDFAKEDKE